MDPSLDLPFALPHGALAAHTDGRPLCGDDGRPLLWVSHVAPDPGLWATARAAHPDTGWWPLLLRWPDHVTDEPNAWERTDWFFPEESHDGRPDAARLLAAQWHDYVAPDPDHDHLTASQRTAVTAPYGARWPGRVDTGGCDPAKADAAADRTATRIARREPVRLGLVRATSGPEALRALGWSGPANYFGVPETVAVLTDWEHRFGTRVVLVDQATLVVSAGVRAVTGEQRRRFAAEHFAFCPDNVWQSGARDLEHYASTLIGATSWTFWWD